MDSHVASPGTAGPVIAIFLICAVVCAVLFLGVEVNYDLTDYLPEDAESTVALDLMMEEFGSGVAQYPGHGSRPHPGRGPWS